jgi:hypothetical protein
VRLSPFSLLNYLVFCFCLFFPFHQIESFLQHDNHPLVAPLHSDGNSPLVVESQIDENLANRDSNRINRDRETSSNSVGRGFVAAPGHNNAVEQQDKQVPKPDNFLRSPVVVEVTPNWNETAKDFKVTFSYKKKTNCLLFVCF